MEGCFSHAKQCKLFELLQKRGGIGTESTFIEQETLLSASRVYGCNFDVEQYEVLLGAREHCAI